MTDVYIYQAALLCEDCGDKVRQDLTAQGQAPADPDDEYGYDSDEFPKGPYPDGGGEADSPQHCDHCHEFLENPLTDEGYRAVKEMLADQQGDPNIEAEWRAFYDIREEEPEDEMEHEGGRRRGQDETVESEVEDVEHILETALSSLEHIEETVAGGTHGLEEAASNPVAAPPPPPMIHGSGLLVSRARIEDQLLAGKRIATRGYSIAIVNRQGRDQVELTGAEIPPMAWPLRRMTAAIEFFAQSVEDAPAKKQYPETCPRCGATITKRLVLDNTTGEWVCAKCLGLSEEASRRAQAEMGTDWTQQMDQSFGIQRSPGGDIIPRERLCESCDGDGCDACGGSGYITREPNVFEQGTPPKTGQFSPTVNPQQPDAVKPPAAKHPVGEGSGADEDVTAIEPGSINEQVDGLDQAGTKGSDTNMGGGVNEEEGFRDPTVIQQGWDQPGTSLPSTEMSGGDPDELPRDLAPKIEPSSKRASKQEVIRRALKGGFAR